MLADGETTMRTDKTTEIEPKYIDVKSGAKYANLGEWKIKDDMRRGCFEVRKAGRRTLIVFSSFKEYLERFPTAKFAPPRNRKPPIDPQDLSPPTGLVKATPAAQRPQRRRRGSRPADAGTTA
jgi:hypothetical protein